MSDIDWKKKALEAESKLVRVAATASSLRAENNSLRRNYRRQRPTYSSIIHRARHDAQLMYAIYLTGSDTTRQRCLEELGISKRRWNWARSLSRLAGIHNGDEFTYRPMPEVITRLRDAAANAEEEPSRLRSFMPRNGGPTRTFGR